MLDGIEITLLSEEELRDLPKPLQMCEQTDLTVITGANIRKEYEDLRKVKPRSTLQLTRTSYLDGDGVYYLSSFDHIIGGQLEERNYSIRPVLKLSPELFYEITKNSHSENGVRTVEFGNYLTDAASAKMQRKLNRLLKFNLLKKVEGYYRLDHSSLEKRDIYEYEGNRYSQVTVDYNNSEERLILSNGKAYKRLSEVWIKEEPIEWIVDEKNSQLISVKALLSGIYFLVQRKYNCQFKETTMGRFMESHMKCDILQFAEIKGKEVETILGKIKENKKYYLGNDDINEKVKQIIDNHNSKIDSLPVEEDTSLKIGFRDEEDLYRDLKLDLNNILDKLIEDSKISKPYFDMIDILSLNKMDDISNLIKVIKKTIDENKLFENVKESLKEELDIVISNNIDRINKYIEELKSNPNIECKTLDELKNEFRSDLQPFLIRLNNASISRDLVKEIKESTIAIINNNYVECKNDRASYLITLIKEVCAVIRTRGNNSDLEKLEQIMDFDIDYSQDILTILKELNEIFKQVYKIELDINNRTNSKERKLKTRVNIDVDSVLN